MDEQTIDLRWLVPDIGKALSNPLSDGSALSAAVVMILFIIFIGFGIAFIWNFHRAQKRIKWVESLLNDINRDNVADFRDELVEKAKNKHATDKVIAHQWLEFDETLVEVTQDGTTQLRNTIDFGHFFNTQTIAKGMTENRLIAAVPGFLTAVGVIGTFAGLQIGLSGLELGGSADEMREGISSVVGGAKIAFMTSIWGIFLSLLFNFLEKMLEQKIRGRLANVEAHVDWIFPRIRPEEQLYEIAEHSEQSREVLQGLAERIGEKMQESLVQATEGIQKGLEASLQTIMAPAINKLVDATSEGNQKALEDLLTKFMDGFGQQGQQQRVAMEGASEKVDASIENMNRTLEAFVLKMERSQELTSCREQELIASISNQVAALSNQMAEQMTTTQKNNSQFTTELESKLSTILQSIATQTQSMNDISREQTTKFTEQMGEQMMVAQQNSSQFTTDLESMLSTILQSIADQTQNMNDTSKEQAAKFADQMTERAQANSAREEALIGEMRDSLSSFLQQVTSETKQISHASTQHVQSLTGKFDERDKVNSAQVQKINDLVEKQANTVTSVTSTMLKSVEDGLQQYQSRADLLLEQGAALQQSMNKSIEASSLASNGMHQSAKELRESADSMAVLGSHMREAGNKLSGAISQAVESTKELSQQNQVAGEKIEYLREQLLNDVRSFEQLAERIQALFDRANNTFDGLNESQTRFLNQQKDHVDSLTTKMTHLLKDYASQANTQTADHLRVWADSANDYAQQTTKAYKALQSIIDGIEEKVSNGVLA